MLVGVGTTTNDAPVITGIVADFNATVNASYDLWAVASDDGNPIPPGELTYEWGVSAGNAGDVLFGDASAANTTVVFLEPGDYSLTLTVNDSEKESTKSVNVSVSSGSTIEYHDEYPDFSGWTRIDIGDHISSTVTDEGVGSVTFKGSGYDIWGSSDSFSYFYTNVSGNFSITTKITSMQTPWDENNPEYNWPKVGLMFRSGLATDSPYVFMGSTLSRLISQSRPSTGFKVATSHTDTEHYAPIWLKLERVSDTFKAYYSVDGTDWIFYESYEMSSPSEISVGLAVASKNDSITYTASFTNVVLEASSIEPSCNTGSWTNDGCGEGSCASTLMRQTRTVSPAGCADNEQCVASSSCSSFSGKEWEQIGPGGGGWYRAIRYNPKNPDEILMSGDQAGMHKSYDGGRTWTFSTDGLYHYAVEDISVSGETVIIATMGGVYKSTDFGEHWKYVWEDIAGPLTRNVTQEQLAWIASVHISKADPNLMFAGSGGHHPVWNRPDVFNVYRSTDGGEHWSISNGGLTDSDMNDGSAKDVVLHFSSDPNNRNIVYMGTRHGFYKSTNAGVTWSKIRNKGSWYSVVDPKNSNIVYTLDFSSSMTGAGQNVYKSTDGGASWAQASEGIDPDANAEEIHFDPTNDNALYIGIRTESLNQIYKSTNGGASWTSVGIPDWTTYNQVSGWGSGGGVATSFDVYGDRMIFVPRIAYTEDGGASWHSGFSTDEGNGYWSGTGAEMECVEGIAFSKTTPGKMYMAIWDEGLLESLDYGDSWKHISDVKETYTIVRKDSDGNPYRCYSGRSVAVDKTDSNVIYVGMADNKARPDGDWTSVPGMITISRDGGETWNTVPNLPERIIHSIKTFDNGNVFAYIEWNGLYKSTNKGKSWTQVSSGLPTNNVGALAADPRNENVLYYGVAWEGLWKSTSGGNTGSWSQKASDDITYPVDISVGPDGTVWVVQGGSNYGVWKSTDGADSFEKVFALDVDSVGFSAGSKINYEVVLADPNDPDTVYVGAKDGYRNFIWNGVGVYVTHDAGETWNFLADGMYHKNVASMNIDSHSGLLYTGVNCHGLFRYNTTD